MNAFIIGRLYCQKFHCILQNLLILYAQYVIAEFGHEELDLHSICIIDHTLPSINRIIINNFTYTVWPVIARVIASAILLYDYT